MGWSSSISTGAAAPQGQHRDITRTLMGQLRITPPRRVRPAAGIDQITVLDGGRVGAMRAPRAVGMLNHPAILPCRWQESRAEK